jgi:hypothetical protein
MLIETTARGGLVQRMCKPIGFISLMEIEQLSLCIQFRMGCRIEFIPHKSLLLNLNKCKLFQLEIQIIKRTSYVS